MISTQRIALTMVLCLLAGVSQATAGLHTIGTANYEGADYNLIYDDAQGLVWLDYRRGMDFWQNQKDWAAGLSFTDAQITLNDGYTTDIEWTTGWRLPRVDESQARLTGEDFGWAGPDATGYHDYAYGYNMLNSEMGHLYYVSLGNLGYLGTDGALQLGHGLVNTGLFESLVDSYTYWSGTEYSSFNAQAWNLSLSRGYQFFMAKSESGDRSYAIAVHEGTVSVVPVPGAAMLGLIGMATARWLKRRRAL